jgi:flavin reductase (DIM6/NTAB) family NADH-FMN oxidoreductase RutF
MGMAVSSFTSVSLDPALASVCVSIASRTWPALRARKRVGLSVLSAAHEQACRQLASRVDDKFAGISWHASPGGAVFIHGAAAWLECDIEQEVRAGDHHIVLLGIRRHGLDAQERPLVFHDSTYRRLAS